MSSSITLTTAIISSMADRVVEARRLHGADSAYVIGLINGINWLLECEGSTAQLRRQFADRVLEGESGKAPAASKSPEPKANGDTSALAENSWIKGSVKWFNNDKGYGFISTDSDTDVFVHWRDISSWDRSLIQGDQVEFMVTKTAKGFQAVNVMKSEKEVPGAEQDIREGSNGDGQTEDESSQAIVDAGTSDESSEEGGEVAGIEESPVETLPGDESQSVEVEDSSPEAPGGTGFGVISSDNVTEEGYDASGSEQSHTNVSRESDTNDSRHVAEGGEA